VVHTPALSIAEQSKSTHTPLLDVTKQSNPELVRVSVTVAIGVMTSVQTDNSPSKKPPIHSIEETEVITTGDVNGSMVTVEVNVTEDVVVGIEVEVEVEGLHVGMSGFKIVKRPLEKQVLTTPTAHKLVWMEH